MLGVANDKGALSILFASDELKAAQWWVSVDERDGAVVVLARRHAAFTTVPDEDRLFTRSLHVYIPQLGIHIMGCQF